MRYTHIFWDFDGTLFDAYPAMASALSEILYVQGVHAPRDEVQAHLQVSLQHAFDYYAARCEHINAADLADRFAVLRTDAEQVFLRPFPHAKTVCETICAAGGHNYLFTHRDHSALDHMARFGMDTVLRDRVIKEDNFPRKPAPDGLIHLLKEYAISPADALMVGDRAIDMESAANAGVAGCFFSPDGKTCPLAKHNITALDELLDLLALR